MKQTLTARERKLLKRVKIRVLSETPNEPNRKLRRAKLRSPSLSTKKRTLGRIKEHNNQVRLGTKEKKGNGLKTLDLIPRK